MFLQMKAERFITLSICSDQKIYPRIFIYDISILTLSLDYTNKQHIKHKQTSNFLNVQVAKSVSSGCGSQPLCFCRRLSYCCAYFSCCCVPSSFCWSSEGDILSFASLVNLFKLVGVCRRNAVYTVEKDQRWTSHYWSQVIKHGAFQITRVKHKIIGALEINFKKR